MQRAVAVPIRAAERPWLYPLLLAVLLVAYNNVLFLLPSGFAYPPLPLLVLRGLLVPAVAVVWSARAFGFAPADVGLTRRGLRRGLSLGAAAAAAIAVPAALYFAFPVSMAGGSVDYERAAGDRVGELVYWGLVSYPLVAVFTEEVLFRGVLQELAARALGLGRGIALTALAFSVWHVAVDYDTIGDTNAADSAAFFAVAQIGALVALFCGGVILSLLRQRGSSLAAPIAFHWLSVVSRRAALFALSG